MKSRWSMGIAALIAVLFALVPLVPGSTKSYVLTFLFLTFINIVLAQSWNLVAGYTGQISLATHAFFALGAYTTAIVWHFDLFRGWYYYFNPILMILSGLVPVVIAVAIGIPLLSKLGGDYFALGSLGVGEILRIVFIKGGNLTGGPMGFVLPTSIFGTLRPHYWTGLLFVILATGAVYYMQNSLTGLALMAVREDETAASSCGIHILSYKVLAFALSAFLAGICGSLYAYYTFQVSPDGFFILRWALYPILMCVIGGSGTVIGPILGALMLTGVFTAASIYLPLIHPIFSGIIIILVMLFMPDGIVRVWERRAGSQSEDSDYSAEEWEEA